MDTEKLVELLKKNGVDDETIEKVVAELEGGEPTPTDDNSGDEDDNASQDEGTPTNNDGEPQTDDTPSDDDNLPPGTNGTEDVEGTPTNTDDEPTPQPNLPSDVVPQDGAPIPPDQPAVPNPDEPTPPAPIGPDPELLSKIEEQAKTIQGLLARVDSLESALKAAGVLDEGNDDEDVVGDESPKPLPTNSNSAGDTFDEVLNDIKNRTRRF